jgi:hypothetical protein
MKCEAPGGDVLAAYRWPDPASDQGEASTPSPGAVRLSALCPDGTAALVVELESDGNALVEYRDARLFAFPLPSVSHLMKQT